ncbi:hypothetical protein [Micromonospora sp. NPDC000668]|uniref:hypothetical protein n=1 Tax=Micromonospora sp. NPDC000668 TaxID=3364219 RepID=UPI00367B28D0
MAGERGGQGRVAADQPQGLGEVTAQAGQRGGRGGQDEFTRGRAGQHDDGAGMQAGRVGESGRQAHPAPVVHGGRGHEVGAGGGIHGVSGRVSVAASMSS